MSDMNGLMISPEAHNSNNNNENRDSGLNLEELLMEPWHQQPASTMSSSPSSTSSSSSPDAIYTQYSPQSHQQQHYISPGSQMSHAGSSGFGLVDESAATASTIDSGVYSYPPSSCSGSNSPKMLAPPSVDSSYFESMLAPSANPNATTVAPQIHSNDFVNIDMMLDEPHSTDHLDLADLGEACHSADLNELLKDVFVENERMLSLDSAGSSASPCSSSSSSSPQLDEATATLLDSSLASSEADDDQETEALLDNIERMLNSMQDQQTVTANNQFLPTTIPPPQTTVNPTRSSNSSTNRTIAIKPVKLEPVDNHSKTSVSGNFKKISPKIAPSTTPKIQPAPVSQPVQQQLAVLTTLPTTCAPIIITTATSEQATEPKTKRARPAADQLVKSAVTVPPTTTLILMPNTTATSPAVKTQPLTPAASSPIILNAAPPSNSPSNLDPNLVKKQNRMIKNRESACLSRKRKKEYMQSLEDNLKETQELNDRLSKENEQLKERVAALEAENKQLKQQQQQQVRPPVIITGAHKIASQTSTVKTSPVNINLSALGIKTTNSGNSSTTSLKRPFIMLAVFFVFGLNIFQFINLNGNITTSNELEPLKVYSVMKNGGGQNNYVTDTESAQLAALAMAQARDGALVDGSLLKNEVVALNSRHLLSEDYEDAEYSGGRRANASSAKTNSTRVNGMDLVLINGTWHVIDLSICQQMFPNSTTPSSNQYFNSTHFNRINNELDGWYKRYMLRSPFSSTAHKAQYSSTGSASSSGSESGATSNEYEKYSASLLKNLNRNNGGVKTRPRFIEEARDRAKSARPSNEPQPKQQSEQKQEEYAISLYDTQTHKHESFANSVRQRNDTFYFVSFRRDHVMYPAMHQNRSQRPRMSLLMPALLTSNLSAANNKNERQQQTIAFMQIDCEVVDTQLVHFNLNDIPMSYMKIIHQDYLANQDPNKEFFNY